MFLRARIERITATSQSNTHYAVFAGAIALVAGFSMFVVRRRFQRLVSLFGSIFGHNYSYSLCLCYTQ